MCKKKDDEFLKLWESRFSANFKYFYDIQTYLNSFLQLLNTKSFLYDFNETTDESKLSAVHLKTKYKKINTILSYFSNLNIFSLSKQKPNRVISLVTLDPTLAFTNFKNKLDNFITCRSRYLKQFKFMEYYANNLMFKSSLGFPSYLELVRFLKNNELEQEKKLLSDFISKISFDIKEVNREVKGDLIQACYEVVLKTNAEVSTGVLKANNLQNTNAYYNITNVNLFILKSTEQKLICIILDLFFNKNIEPLIGLKKFYQLDNLNSVTNEESIINSAVI